LSIGLSSKDRAHLEQFKFDIQAEHPIHNYLVKNSKRNPKWSDSEKSEIAFESKRIFDDLKRFGIKPRKTDVYTFPKWLLDYELLRPFMLGYFDGDGSFYWQKYKQKQNQLCVCVRGTARFLKVYRTILEERCDLDKRDGPIQISNGIGKLEYGGNGVAKKIGDFLYTGASVYLPRKYDLYRSIISHS
jgi:hypothetical protein